MEILNNMLSNLGTFLKSGANFNVLYKMPNGPILQPDPKISIGKYFPAISHHYKVGNYH